MSYLVTSHCIKVVFPYCNHAVQMYGYDIGRCLHYALELLGLLKTIIVRSTFVGVCGLKMITFTNLKIISVHHYYNSGRQGATLLL